MLQIAYFALHSVVNIRYIDFNMLVLSFTGRKETRCYVKSLF